MICYGNDRQDYPDTHDCMSSGRLPGILGEMTHEAVILHELFSQYFLSIAKQYRGIHSAS